MSYDLTIWKEPRELSCPPDEILEKLIEDEDVEEVAELPIEAIKQRFPMRFPGGEVKPRYMSWTATNASVFFYFNPSRSVKHLEVCISAETYHAMERVIRFAHEFNLDVYDEQSGDTYRPSDFRP